MLILAVDTSSRTGSAALMRDSQVLAEISRFEEAPYSSRLFRDVAQLQTRANFRMDEVDVFAVAAGPGSFTGLRVGLTAVKAWAEVHRKPIAAISGLEAVAAEFLVGESSGAFDISFIAPFLDARRGQLFGAIYQKLSGDHGDLAPASDESILSPDEFLELVKGKSPLPLQIVSPTPEVLSASRIREVLPGASVVQVSAALAPAIGRLGYERAKRGDLVNSVSLDANYVRRSDALGAWRDR